MATITSLDDHDAAPHANLFPDQEPHKIKLTLDAGERVPGHTHPGRRIVFALLDGAIELRLGEDTHAVTAGDVARFDGDQEIEPRATEPSTALIVLAPE
jgi:quercetin dioxygenase-like cupin family protein